MYPWISDRHVLVSVTDEVGGGETAYERTRGSIPGTADVVVPSTFYLGVTQPEGGRTAFEYDSLERPVRRVLPKTATESAVPEETFVYDDAAHTLTQTDAAGRVTVTTTDLEGRVVRIDNGAGGTKLFGYDPAGNKTLETAWFDGSTPRVETTFVYDAAGRLTERREPLHGNGGRTTSYAYDPVGNLVRETLFDRTDPGFAPRVTESAYDGLNRKVEERRLTDSGPVVVQTRYDGAGNPVRVTDPLGRVTETELDALDRPIRVRGRRAGRRSTSTTARGISSRNGG